MKWDEYAVIAALFALILYWHIGGRMSGVPAGKLGRTIQVQQAADAGSKWYLLFLPTLR